MSTTWTIWRVAGLGAATVMVFAACSADQGPLAAEKAPTADAGKVAVAVVRPGDCNQFFGGPQRNNVVATKVPNAWDLKSGKGVKWVSQLGSQTYGNTVVANGKVLRWHEQRRRLSSSAIPADGRPGRAGSALTKRTASSSGSTPAKSCPPGACTTGRCRASAAHRWSKGERLWFVTSRGEVLCLDAEGFHDGQDDGPGITVEPVNACSTIARRPTTGCRTK